MEDELEELGVVKEDVRTRLKAAGYSTKEQLAVADPDSPVGGVPAHISAPWVAQARRLVVKEQVVHIALDDQIITVRLRKSTTPATKVSIRWLLGVRDSGDGPWTNCTFVAKDKQLTFSFPPSPGKPCASMEMSNQSFHTCGQPSDDWDLSEGGTFCRQHMAGRKSRRVHEFQNLRDRAEAEKVRLGV